MCVMIEVGKTYKTKVGNYSVLIINIEIIDGVELFNGDVTIKKGHIHKARYSKNGKAQNRSFFMDIDFNNALDHTP